MTETSENRPVLVAGYVNLDRIWPLSQALHTGRRHHYSESQIRLGGGGYFTGSELLTLGREVELLCWIGQDPHGKSTEASLRDQGFRLELANRAMPESVLLEILLDPDGERTILSPEVDYPPLELPAGRVLDGAYVNLRDPGRILPVTVQEIPLVMVQLPLRPTTRPLPADVAITSRGDFANYSIGQIWQRAEALCGERLGLLVVTNGAGGIILHHRNGREEVILPRRTIEGVDFIGAGDIFAGALLDALLMGYDPASACLRAADVTGTRLTSRPAMAQAALGGSGG